MALLQTKKGNMLPSEAVALPKTEALKYQKKFVDNWPVPHEVFFLKYGGYVTAGATTISSYLIFNLFKRTFNLKASGRTLFILIPSVALPAAFSVFFTEKVLTEKILLMKLSCPLCQQLVFGLSHFYISTLYPALYSYISLSSVAYHFNSYYIPNIKTQPKEFWKASVQILKNSGHTFRPIGLLQTIIILSLPFLQNKELVHISNKTKENYYSDISDNIKNVQNKL